VSTRANDSDGGFDAVGRTIAAEQFPTTLTCGDAQFKLGPTRDGRKNAVACRGQTIALPAGEFDRLHLLAACDDGDARAEFDVDGHKTQLTIQNWTGYVGQWDNRLWEGEMPESGSPSNAMIGLLPGYVKPAEVAWYCSHIHAPGKGDQFYQYSYLYHYAVPLTGGARTLTLPDNEHVRIFAIAMTRDVAPPLRAAGPLFDTLQDHVPDAPVIAGPTVGASHEGPFADSILVTIDNPLYHQKSGLHYTLDGGDPTTDSPTYTRPIAVATRTTVKAKMFMPGKPQSPVASATFEVDDTTPPSLRSATGFANTAEIRVTFSEPVEKSSGETVANYRLELAAEVKSVALVDDDCATATLKLASPLSDGSDCRLTVSGVKDRSPAGNAMTSLTMPVKILTPVFSRTSLATTRPGETFQKLPDLPIHARDPWTINVMVRVTKQPDNRTLIVGFGSASTEAEGRGRYLSKFANGIHFWSERRDGESGTQLDLNRWQMLTATYDGQMLTLYKNAKPIGQQRLELADDEPAVRVAPLDPWDKKRTFKGELKDLTIWKAALSADALDALWQRQQP
jgi:alpha-mannosidase